MKKIILCLGLVAGLSLAIPGQVGAQFKRMEDLAYILGQAEACGMDVRYESKQLLDWITRSMSGDTLRVSLDNSMSANRKGKIDQKGGRTGIGCTHVEKLVKDTDWP